MAAKKKARGLTLAQLLQTSKPKVVEVKVEGAKDPLYIRSMTGAQRDTFEIETYRRRAELQKKHGDAFLPEMVLGENARARLLALCLCDSEGNLIAGPEDVEALGNMNAALVQKLFDVATELNKVSDADMEELAGN